MFIFTQPVFQVGGNTSEGVLMRLPNKELKVRQYFERHGCEDVEFADAAAFCEFLEKKYYKDGRTIFFKEESNSRNLTVYSTSPYKDYEREVFVMGEFQYTA